jgi:hypothetical protein
VGFSSEERAGLFLHQESSGFSCLKRWLKVHCAG